MASWLAGWLVVQNYRVPFSPQCTPCIRNCVNSFVSSPAWPGLVASSIAHAEGALFRFGPVSEVAQVVEVAKVNERFNPKLSDKDFIFCVGKRFEVQRDVLER